MTEDEKVKYINSNATEYLQFWLDKLETEERIPEDLLSALYATMIATSLLGYDLDVIMSDVKIAAEKIANQAKNEGVDISSESV
jgi:hypothetical protein